MLDQAMYEWEIRYDYHGLGGKEMKHEQFHILGEKN